MITTNNKIDTFDYLWKNGQIDEEMVRNATSHVDEKVKQKDLIPLGDILELVAKHFFISPGDLLGSSHLQYIVYARWIYIKLARDEGHPSSTASIYINKSHEFGQYAFNQINEMMDSKSLRYDKVIEGWYYHIRRIMYEK